MANRDSNADTHLTDRKSKSYLEVALGSWETMPKRKRKGVCLNFDVAVETIVDLDDKRVAKKPTSTIAAYVPAITDGNYYAAPRYWILTCVSNTAYLILYYTQCVGRCGCGRHAMR